MPAGDRVCARVSESGERMSTSCSSACTSSRGRSCSRLRRRVLLVGADRRGEGDVVAAQRVPDGLADVGVDAVAQRVVAREVLDLVDDGGVGERADAREDRHLARDAVDVRRGLDEDADHRGRRDVVVDADLQHARR